LASLIPTFAVDVVGVYNQDFIQVFEKARPIKAYIKESSKLMVHPVENGIETADHRIILPVEIELSMILLSPYYLDTYNDIKKISNEATLLTIQTRSGLYQNQLIESFPHEENPENYDALILALKLKEVNIVTSSFETVSKNPTNASTKERGSISPTETSQEDTEKSSFAFEKFIK